MKPISIVDAFNYYSEQPYQTEAIKYLDSQIDEKTRSKFGNLFRNDTGDNKHFLENFSYISQRDAIGDWNNDGRLEKWQTCNVTSVAMVVEFLTGKKVTPKQLDYLVRKKFGSRYVHSNLVKLLKLYGIHSDFDVSTTHKEIKQCLREGNPVIWSNKLTHGGHIVVITGYDDDNLAYQIHDPYGEPFPTNTARTKWRYRDIRSPYLLSYRSFNTVNMNGYLYYKKEHWCHLCKLSL